MSWSRRGLVAAVLFGVLALTELVADDPLLWMLCYLGASGMGVQLSRGRPVARWICIILVVFPAELALMSLLFEPDELLAAATTPQQVLTRAAARQALGMLVVAAWSAWIAFARPFDDELLEGQPPSV
ncbi:MAG: hypothetical protein H6732_06230 [Alphaproteobacteria bacterium]|nr:hypothetical protein [Alphaproteobacteria bacterium]